ncbi:MAG: prepilin-type N-terminal cleavage/methylation domain-containing protein [Chlorobia bacterium]|nr:prepilin-type N-terminal cleavage/methylation domain-containing protein [Fimbriimonadaceae bacterium]
MKRAFTLIELLVVIAIIAILAAILFPVFAQAKLAAKKAAGLSQAKQIGTSMHIYLADYDDVFFKYRFNGPAGSNLNTDYQKMLASNPAQANIVFGANSRDVIFAKQLLDPYIKNNDIWKAPTQVNAWSGGDMSGANQDPAFRSYGGQNSYGLNSYLFPAVASSSPYSATAIEGPSSTYVMIDASYYNVLPKNPCILPSQASFSSMSSWPAGGSSYPNYWKNLGNAYFFTFPAPPAMTDAEWMKKVDARYNGILNTVRADSSAKAVASNKVVNDGPKVGYNESFWDPFKQGCQ